jgi:hypothetical protein
MRDHSFPIGILAITCALLADAAPASAGIETWVSPTGTNAGTCPITAPCKTLAFAHGQTTANGTIHVLSSGNFGPLTVTKSISIVAQGVEAMINTGAAGAAILVQAGAADVISLRGLTIDMRGTANKGISFVSGAALHVHDSVIRGSTNGIQFAPTSGTSELYVVDSIIANNSQRGIFVAPTGSGGVKAVLDRVRVENGTDMGIRFDGFSTTGSITATVRDSVAAGNGSQGITAAEFGSGTTTVTIDRTASVNNGTGGIVAAGAGAVIRIGDSTVTGNFGGLSLVGGGLIASYGTNKVSSNVNDGVPSSTIGMK